MVNLNWEMLRTVNVDEIGDEETGELYQQLSDVNVDEENDIDNVKLMFKAAQAIMQAKSVQAEVALEELAKFENVQQSSTPREIKEKVDVLNAQISKLKAQLSNEKERNNSSDGVKLQQQVEQLKSDVQEKNRQLSAEKKDNERLNSRLEDSEKERKDLARENAQLKDEVEDIRQHRSGSNDQDGGHQQAKNEQHNKLREKNRQISELLEEVEVFEQQNAQLQRQVAGLRDKLQDATIQMDKVTAEYIQLKSAVQQSNSQIETLQMENEKLTLYTSDLAEQHEARILADDEIISAVSQRVEEWKTILTEKDSTILKLQSETVQLNETLMLRGVNVNGSTIGLLTKTVQDRDEKVANLTQQLEQATRDLEESTSCIEKLKRAQHRDEVGEWQLKQIESLQARLVDQEGQEHELREKAREAESHAREKDSELTEALLQLRKYEKGEYGLEDAVQEIKEHKLQLRLRDQQIVDLTLAVNQAEMALGELGDENDVLCEKLGIKRKDLDSAELQARVSTRRNQERALNSVLQQEVVELEEERLDLKQEVRKLAQILGHRASKYGLTSEDAKKLQSYADKLGMKNINAPHHEESTEMHSVFQEVTQQVKLLQLELESTRKQITSVGYQYEERATDVGQLSNEEKQLSNLLRIFQDTCSDESFESKVKILKKLLLSFNETDLKSETVPQPLAESDTVTKVCLNKISGEEKDNLIGHSSIDEEPNKVGDIPHILENDMECNRSDEPAPFQDALSKVNSRILIYLRKLEVSETLSSTLKLVVTSSDGQQDPNETMDQLKLENERLKAERIEHEVKIEQVDKLLASLSKKEEDDLRADLVELSRELTVSKVSERTLLRKCSFLLECEKQLRRENDSRAREILVMQGAVLHRIGYLERFKNIATFKMASLHRALQSSVAITELEACQQKYEDARAAYQELIRPLTDQRTTVEPGYQNLQQENDNIKMELQGAIEKLHFFETKWSEATSISGTNIAGNDATAKRMALLEMNQLNERQRADHSAALYAEQRQMVTKLEERNFQLEQEVSRLSKLGLAQQSTEADLQRQLEGSVTGTEYERIRQQLELLHAQEVLDKEEISQLRVLLEIALNQTGDVESRRDAKEKEIVVLRQNLVDVQSGSDEKTLVGKLYRQLVGLQIGESALQHKLEKCQNQLTKIEALALRLEQKCDEKDQAIFALRSEASFKINNLRNKNRELNLRVKGVSSFVEYEKFALMTVQIQRDKIQISSELDQAREQRFLVEERVREFEIRNRTMEEVISKVRNEGEAIQIMDWQKKLTEVRISEMKKSHLLEKRDFDLECKDKLIANHEKKIANLEEKFARIESEQEEQIFSLKSRERDMGTFSLKLGGNISDSVPQTMPKFSSDQQVSVTQNHSDNLESREQNLRLKRNVQELSEKNSILELTIGARDKVIKELKANAMLAPNSDKSYYHETVIEKEAEKIFVHTDKAVRVAQSLIKDMKVRLSQKEETIHKYEELLDRVRGEMTTMSRSHQQEMESVRSKILVNSNSAVQQLRQTMLESFERAQASSQIPEQIMKMNELKEVALQQDHAITVLTDKLKSSSKEIRHWQLKVEGTAKELMQEKEKSQLEFEDVIEKLGKEIKTLQAENSNKDLELYEIRDRLAEQVELAKMAPVPSMKQAISNLKQEVGRKEKQIQALSGSLVELKETMKEMAEDSARAKFRGDAEVSTVEVQEVVRHQTRNLQEKLDAVIVENHHLKMGAKKRPVHKTDSTSLQQNLDRHVAMVSDLKKEKSHLEEVIRDLEEKIRRISRTEENDVMEVNVLRGRLRELEEKLASSGPAEKPYERQLSPSGSSDHHKSNAYGAWTETKRLQQVIGKLRDKLSERDREVAKLEASIATCKSVIVRLEKAKVVAEKRLKEMQPSFPSSKTDVGASLEHSPDYIHGLQSKCFNLQQEISSLRQNMFHEKDSIILELQKKNEFLSKRLDRTAHIWNSTSSVASPRKVSTALAEELQVLRLQEDELHKEVLRLSQDNSELNFKIEIMQNDLPQFKARILHLEGYIDVLKTGNPKEDPLTARSALESPRKTRLGNSGRNAVELESTIATLKKVLQKLQAENDRLKKLSQDHGQVVHSVQEENRKLQSELKAIQMSCEPSPQLLAKQEKGVAKIVAHNERLLQDLRAEVRTNETLRLQLHASTAEKEKLELDAIDRQRQLEELKAHRPDLSSLGGQRWKSEVAIQMLEEKLIATETELKQRNVVVSALKMLVLEAVVLEEEALRTGMLSRDEKKDLSIKVRFKQLMRTAS